MEPMRPSFNAIYTKMDPLLIYMGRRWCTFLHKLAELGIRQTAKFEFPFSRLPVVAASEVVKFMDIPDRIKLAITSTRMGNLVRRVSVKQPLHYRFVVCKKYITINIYLNNFAVAMISDSSRHSYRSNRIGTLELVPWLDRKYSDMQNIAHIFKKLRRFIPVKSFDLLLTIDGLTEKHMKEMFAIPEFTNIQGVEIFGEEKIESDILKMIMDSCDTKIFFSVTNCEIPSDYHHPKAFKFSSVHYEHACWVKIEDLLTLENSDEVILSQNELSSEDVNRFLKFWIESDLNMFREFSMSAETLDMTEALKDLMLVETSRGDQGFLVVKASRKPKVMSMHIERWNLKFRVYSPEESFSKEYKVLELMEKKKKLENELVALEGNEARRLSMEIRELTKELDSMCTFSDDGLVVVAQ